MRRALSVGWELAGDCLRVQMTSRFQKRLVTTGPNRRFPLDANALRRARCSESARTHNNISGGTTYEAPIVPRTRTLAAATTIPDRRILELLPSKPQHRASFSSSVACDVLPVTAVRASIALRRALRGHLETQYLSKATVQSSGPVLSSDYTIQYYSCQRIRECDIGNPKRRLCWNATVDN